MLNTHNLFRLLALLVFLVGKHITATNSISSRDNLRQLNDKNLNHSNQTTSSHSQSQYPNSNATANRSTQQQQHKQKAPHQQEISCDELNLIVKSQEVFNINATIAASQVIGCQHIDPTLASKSVATPAVAPKPKLKPSSATFDSVRQFNGTFMVHEIHRPAPEFNVELNSSASDESTHGAHQLHFGAKVALSVLLSIILLVASATFVDLNSSIEYNDSNSTTNRNQLHQFHLNQQAREQRSPSLSSSSSSSLFCSVASVSAPILGNNRSVLSNSEGINLKSGSHQKHRSCNEWYKFGQNSTGNRYELNLQMLFSPTRTSVDSMAISTPCEIIKKRSQEENLLWAVLRTERWHRQALSSEQHSMEEAQTKLDRNNSYGCNSFARQLIKQLFLSFSLRHSISLIFQSSNNNSNQHISAPGQQHQQQQVSPSLSCRLTNKSSCGHRSRVSSLSSINEVTQNDQEDKSSSDFEDSSITNQANLHYYHHQRCRHQQQSQSQSIDSLHGLRFLSMIWIIVIHSYNFALRWSFFTNASALDDIYKTAASQLVANGTFACDSFFFAGGFLLPYLAFPAFNPESTQTIQSVSTSSLAYRSPSTTTSSGRMTKEAKCKQDSSIPGSACSSIENQTHEDNFSSGNSCDSRQSAAANSCLNSPTSVPHTCQAASQSINNHHQNLAWQQSQQQQQHQQQQQVLLNTNEFNFGRVMGNMLHRYIRMMPLMMAVIGLSATLLRYLGEGPTWDDSTMMYDKWCRKNWWINALFLHNFFNRENMCLSHSWYSAVDIQLFLIGQLILFVLFRSRKFGILICCTFLFGAQLITGALTLIHHLPAVPLIASVSEQSMNLYYGEIYIKPYCRASPYLIGILLAYLMRTTSLGQVRLQKWQVATGWTASIGTLLAILLAMQPAMNGQPPSELQSALYSALSRPLWACATGWMIFACMTKHGGFFESILSARCFVPLSRLTYPAFLIHPIVMAVFYGSRESSFHFSHYLMLYLILGNIVITYASAFILSALFELPLLSAEQAIKRAWSYDSHH